MELLPGLDAKALGEQNLHVCSSHEKVLNRTGYPGFLAQIAAPGFAEGKEGVFWMEGREKSL